MFAFEDEVTLAGFGVPADAPLQTDLFSQFRQSRNSLGELAGESEIRIQFRYNVGSTGAAAASGLLLDNFIVGFAERGEIVSGATAGEVDFTPATAFGVSNYQLEIRPSTDYRTVVGLPGPDQPVIGESFDTNERMARSVTIVAPLPSDINTGDTFTLSDNARAVTFQFVRGGGPTQVGVVPVNIAGLTTRGEVAGQLTRVFASPAVQSLLSFTATDSSGTSGAVTNASVPTTDPLVAISGFITGSLFDVPEDQLDVSTTAANPGGGAGAILLPALINEFFGDVNTLRSQTQFIVAQSRISDVNAVGIFQEAGTRAGDETGLTFNRFGSTVFTSTELFLQPAPIGTTTPGAVRNLPGGNASVLGGLSQGILVENNIIDQAGYAGVRIEGDQRPLVIDSPLFGFGEQDGDPNDVDTDFGDFIADGLVMTIEASGVAVNFEFEDIGGGGADGSGTLGGDGYEDGHVPIFFRHFTEPVDRADTRHEVMLSIYEAITSSILVTNDLVELVEPRLALSQRFNNQTLSDFFVDGFIATLANPGAAVYLQGASQIRFNIAGLPGNPNPFITYFADVAEAPQPVAQIVNNTIYGADGTEFRTAQQAVDGAVDSDDLISGAVDTKIGRSHQSAYVTGGTIGNGAVVLSAGQDVDLYEVELVVGDRLIVDIDTVVNQINRAEGSRLIPADLTLQLLDSTGRVVAENFARSVPPTLENGGEFNDSDALPLLNAQGQVVLEDGVPVPFGDGQTLFNGVDPSLDYTSLATDTYYVAVLGAGNENFSARSLSGRTDGATGDYTLSIEAFTPRTAVVSIDGNDAGTVGADLVGSSVLVTQVADVFGNAGNNTVQFVFTGPDGAGLAQAQDLGAAAVVAVTLDIVGRENEVPEIIRALTREISLNPFTLNQAVEVSPDLVGFDDGTPGVLGPVRPVFAVAIGGEEGGNFQPYELFPDADITPFEVDAVLSPAIARGGVIFTRDTGVPGGNVARTVLADTVVEGLETFRLFGGGLTSYNRFGLSFGFGLDQPDLAAPSNPGPNPIGVSELYAVLQNVSRVQVFGPEGGGGTPLRVDPAPGVNLDQVLPEVGVQLVAGVSGTVINNVLTNLAESVVVEELTTGDTLDNQIERGGSGFFNGDDDFLSVPLGRVPDVVVTSNLFQFDEVNSTILRQNITQNGVNAAGNAGQQTLTDAIAGPSNVNGGNDDRNIDLDRLGLPARSVPTDPLLPDQFVNADGNNFIPRFDSRIIDSGTSALVERPGLSAVRIAAGLSVSNLIAPTADINGTTRAGQPQRGPPLGHRRRPVRRPRGGRAGRLQRPLRGADQPAGQRLGGHRRRSDGRPRRFAARTG